MRFMQGKSSLQLTVALLVVIGSGQAGGEPARTVVEWWFDNTVKWNGWSPSGAIQNVAFAADSVSFDATGADPIISGPWFEPKPASNQQWVEIDIDVPGPATGELFYTNKRQSQYDGFEAQWTTPYWTSAGGRQTVTVWPFWSALGNIIRLRVDPPSETHCKLYAVRIVELVGTGSPPAWTFGEQEDSWRPMHAASMKRSKDGLLVTASQPQAMIVTAVEPFDASKRSILRFNGSPQLVDKPVFNLYWATKEEEGFFGQPIAFDRSPGAGKVRTFDLRQFPQWKGTVTHLAIAFADEADETIVIRSLSVDGNAGTPFSPKPPAFTKPRARSDHAVAAIWGAGILPAERRRAGMPAPHHSGPRNAAII